MLSFLLFFVSDRSNDQGASRSFFFPFFLFFLTRESQFAKNAVFAALQATELLVWRTDDLFANAGSRGQSSLVGRGAKPHKTTQRREF